MANCKVPLAPDGTQSKLYSLLQRLCGERGHFLANYIYATYKATNLADKLDLLGKERSHGEHSARDVWEALLGNLLRFEYFRDVIAGKDLITGKMIQYNTAEDALTEAENFNANNKGKVAHVVLVGDHYLLVTEQRDSRTIMTADLVTNLLLVWSTLSNEFNNAGIDLSAFDFIKDIANPLKVPDFIHYLASITTAPNDTLSLRDIQTLLTMSADKPLIKRLNNRFLGTLEETALLVYDALHSGTVAPATVTFVENALNDAKVYSINLTLVTNNIKNQSANFYASLESTTIQQEINDLHRKHKVNEEVLTRDSLEIKSLQEAAIEAAFSLQRQAKRLRNLSGKALSKNLERELESLMLEIELKKYYGGLLRFLNRAVNYATVVEKILKTVPNTGTKFEYAVAKADAISRANNFRNSYLHIVNSLLKIDELMVDENITQADKDALLQKAEEVKLHLDAQSTTIKGLATNTLYDLSAEIMGTNNLSAGEAIVNFVLMAKADSTMFDYLYSVGQSGHVLTSTLGAIIRMELDKRNSELQKFMEEIRDANLDLERAGHTSEFIYDESNHIISDIDWVAYNKARNIARALYKESGLKGVDLEEAMDIWEENNTEDRVVDASAVDENGNPRPRTERVPNAAYQDSSIAIWDSVNNKLIFQNGILTKALLEYYDKMMEIKGKLGTMLPSYAQKLYLPPQRRKSWMDVISDALHKKMSLREAADSLLERMKIWKIKLDETEYADNGNIFTGEDHIGVSSDYDDTRLLLIPIFYINRLENQSDLLKDFSGCMDSLATTAINYAHMNKIRNLAEFIGIYAQDKLLIQELVQNKGAIDVIRNKGIAIAKFIKQKGKSTRTSEIINGFILYHIYGVKTKDTGKWAVFMRHLINYSSLKGLAMNVKGAISNFTVGEIQNVIEACGGENFNARDLIWAHGKLFGNSRLAGALTLGASDGGSRIMDYLFNRRNSKAMLLSELFDPVVENFRESQERRYHTSIFRKLFGSFNPMTGYSYGEYLIHFANMYAMLHHLKMYKDGKLISLYDALIKTPLLHGSSDLVLDLGVTIGEKVNGKWRDSGRAADEDFLLLMKGKIKSTNQKCHGAMNEEDKGLIHLRMLGKAVMNFRQWMVGHYSRRWRGEYYDADARRFDKGYRREALAFYRDMVKGWFGMEVQSAAHWDELDDRAKSNINKFWGENAMLGLLFGLSMAMGDPDKKNREWWTRMFMYQVNRALMDEVASTSFGSLWELKTMVNSPVAAVNTINGLIYIPLGLVNGDLGETVKSGKYKGWNKYAKGFYKYALPFGYLIDQTINMATEDDLFSVFNLENKLK